MTPEQRSQLIALAKLALEGEKGWTECFVTFPDAHAILVELVESIERETVAEHGNQYDAGFNYGIRRAARIVDAARARLASKAQPRNITEPQEVEPLEGNDDLPPAMSDSRSRARVRDELGAIILQAILRNVWNDKAISAEVDRVLGLLCDRAVPNKPAVSFLDDVKEGRL